MTAPVRTQIVAEATVARRRPVVGTLAPALLSSGLLWLCFFPVNWGWLGWVSLVPLLTLVKSDARPRTVYLCAWASGLLFFWPALQWMRVADYRMYFTWAALATYCSLYFPLALYVMRLLVRRTRLPFVVIVPVVWTALEFFRSYFITGFPWYLLAHSQHDQLHLIQVSDITGAWGITFLVAAVNAFLCQIVLAWLGRPIATRRGLIVGGVSIAVALAGVYAYGVWRAGQADFEDGPVVALMQGNLPQYLRNNPTTAESIAQHYVALCDLAAAAKPAIVIWPETSMPFVWEETWPDGVAAGTRDFCKDCARHFRVPVLFGLNSVVVGPEGDTRRYNSAALVDKQGKAAARYDKIHRVPFGEYVPLRDWLPFMDWFAPYDFDYSVTAGAGATRFPLTREPADGQAWSFGVVICYEDTDPDITRLNAGAGGRAPADLLVNISNDGWFEGTSEHEQHLAVCRFRAVECRRPVARAVNMGISALIDGNGRVLAPTQIGTANVPSGVGPEPATAARWQVTTRSEPLPTGRWHEFKSVCGVLLAELPLDRRTSFYARWGDWLPWSCWGLLGACVLAAARRRPMEI
jgi:apolipoprotein N-acyltransferase